MAEDKAYTEARQNLENLGMYLVGLKQANDELRARPLNSPQIEYFLDLIQPDIVRSENLILHDQRLIDLIAAYREIRPK